MTLARELTSQHERSPGLVDAGETVCRAAYTPMHFKKSTIKGSFIKGSDLLAGELSVWRVGRRQDFGISEVVCLLTAYAPGNQHLGAILGGTAEAVRALRVDSINADRMFCVLDDCSTDRGGSWHIEHATIALAEIDSIVWAVDGDEFVVAKEVLAQFLKRQQLWPEPPAQVRAA